jgi:hypothetical protein
MKIVTSVSLFLISFSLFAQKTKPDLSEITDKTVWETYNRSAFTVSENGETILKLDARQNDGLVVLQDFEFENGTIEFDIKGKDVLQRSFVGFAFHIQNDKEFNAIYFRPFNFKKPERSSHSVQYISHPEFTWQFLRSNFPEQFENNVTPVPNPEDWFHAKIEVVWPKVKVYIENSKTPSLDIEMKSNFTKGKVGFWVGNGSDGEFKNLVITKK